MTDLTALRIASAKALGKHVYVGRLSHDVKISEPESSELDPAWQPEKDPAQLVELIEWLRQQGCELIVASPDWENFDVQVSTPEGDTANYKGHWRECIMRAVAEIGDES